MPGRITVLHVDDNPEFGDLTATFLERGDVDVHVETVTRADLAVSTLDDVPVDCVVSDYDMPGMDGLELLAAVREEYPDLPFILFTGKGSEEIASEAISAGVTDYIQKGGAEQFALLSNRVEHAVTQARAHTELEASRQRYRAVVDTFGEGIFIQDADGTVKEHNEAAETILGVPPGDRVDAIQSGSATIVDAAGDRVDPADLPSVTVREDGVAVSDVRLGIEVDDDRRWVSVSARPLEDAGDDGDSVVWFSDVTEQVELETELRASRSKIARLHDVATTLETCRTREEAFDVAVHAAEQILEFDVCYVGLVEDGHFQTAATSSDLSSIPETGLASDEGIAGRAYQNRESFVVDDSKAHPTAEPIADEFVSSVTVPVGDYGVFQAHRDETDAFDEDDMELAELLVAHLTEALNSFESDRALRESEELYRTLVEGSHDGIYIYLDAEFEFVNERVVELTGYSRDELYEMNIWDLVHLEDQERIRESAKASDGDPIVREARIIRKDGTTRHMSLSTSAIVYDGEPAYMGAARDVTERKAREEDLERQNERLEEFASVVSHDLQNPLTVARGNLDIARETGDEGAFETVADAHERMSAIIEDVLTLARDGRSVGTTSPVHLAEVVSAAWSGVATGSVSLSMGDLSSVAADRGRLQRLFENLFRNAVEHGGSDVTVSVGTVDDGFYVEDDGAGIPEDVRARVFESGYSTSDSGTGFGLAIVREIADAHGWSVSVAESDAGGTRFEVRDVDRPKSRV